MNVDIVTMIDNFIVATDDPEAFVQAVQTFIQRCDEFGAVLNDRESYPSDPAAILKMGRETASTWTSILGAEYKDGLVRNTEKNLKNLNDAYLRLQRAASDPSVVVTRRHIAALISLAFYMARIIDVRVAQHFPMIRLHQKMSSMRGSWDSAYKPSINEMNNLAKLVGIIMPNVPVRPTLTPLPGSDFSDYDAAIIFDASATGYGAWVLMDGTIYEVRSGWRNTACGSLLTPSPPPERKSSRGCAQDAKDASPSSPTTSPWQWPNGAPSPGTAASPPHSLSTSSSSPCTARRATSSPTCSTARASRIRPTASPAATASETLSGSQSTRR